MLTDKYDIAFQPANANTIQDGKTTVKVGDAQKTLNEDGELKQMQMGQKVTINAATGYKFRKVEAKGAAPKLLSRTLNTDNGSFTIYYAEGES